MSGPSGLFHANERPVGGNRPARVAAVLESEVGRVGNPGICHDSGLGAESGQIGLGTSRGPGVMGSGGSVHVTFNRDGRGQGALKEGADARPRSSQFLPSSRRSAGWRPRVGGNDGSVTRPVYPSSTSDHSNREDQQV